MVHSKGKKGIALSNVCQKMLDKSDRQPNLIWVDKGSEFYNRSIKPWLQDNDIGMYLTHNEENLLFLKDLLQH